MLDALNNDTSRLLLVGSVVALLVINVLLILQLMARQQLRRPSSSLDDPVNREHKQRTTATTAHETTNVASAYSAAAEGDHESQLDNITISPGFTRSGSRTDGSSPLHHRTTTPTPPLRTATSDETTTGHSTYPSSSSSFDVKYAVEEIHKWLFLKGGHLQGAQALITEFCQSQVRDVVGIPLDRFLIGGLVIHPQVSAFDWKWEMKKEFQFSEVPSTLFEDEVLLQKLQKEPFIQLMQRKTNEIRITTAEQAEGSSVYKLFVPSRGGENNKQQEQPYTDYFALPMMHRGEFKGGMAWSTRHPGGFTDDHLLFFRSILAALSTVMRLHTNEHVVGTLLGNLQTQVEERTKELEVANASLALANQRIQQQSNAQLKHFAMMSHEIRTPLNCIVGMSSLLLETMTTTTSSSSLESPYEYDDIDGDDKDQLLDSIRMITSSGNLLRAVVDDVLDYSKLEYGKVELSIERTNVLETCRTVVRTIRTMGKEERNIAVECHFGRNNKRIPRVLQTDGRRLQQVLYNLLGNAMKFSKEGGVIYFSVYCSTTTTTKGNADDDDDTKKQDTNNGNDNKSDQQQEQQQSYLHFSIRDTGKGIPPSELSAIFRPFHQVVNKERGSNTNDDKDDDDGKQKKLHGGTGLGLAITSKIVTALGGTIQVQSKGIGHGAEFIVTLPYRDDEQEQKEDGFLKDENDDVKETVSETDEIRLQEQQRHREVLSNQTRTAISADAQRTPGDGSTTTTTTSTLVTPTVTALPFNDGGVCNDNNNKMGNSVVPPSSASLHPDKRSTSRPLRILVAEDNVVNQKVLERMLGRVAKQEQKGSPMAQGIVVDVVDNGAEAVERASSSPYDLILMDMEMPIMGGLEATERIVRAHQKQGQQQQKPKIVFLTAHVQDSFRQEAQKVGGDGFISKPFTLKTIKNLMASMMRDDNNDSGRSNSTMTRAAEDGNNDVWFK
uniref:histidine kinase n=1 Tax=Grammatophora oceanica TaxID=210454 RepID=A0A7S1Y743_9STRA|mmetsp:Transcript_27114/g.39697  ORF Transcript_27114/g.39697 Transcript_27114/m.39697 type:complete len:950 (+) Transcript_27114:29-2878(+)